MPVKYSDVKLLAFIAKSFEDKDGITVEYNEAHFLLEAENGERSVIILNTKLDLLMDEEKTGTLTVEIDPSGKRKTRLVSFVV